MHDVAIKMEKGPSIAEIVDDMSIPDFVKYGLRHKNPPWRRGVFVLHRQL